MDALIKIDYSTCTNCFTCVRICPVKAIKVSKMKAYPEVQSNRCIGCGDCVNACVPGAIHSRSSIDDVKHILKSKLKKVVIVSPSISAEFDDITDYRKFVQMIKSLGVNYVNEVSFAVDVLASKYQSLFNDFKGRYYISSCDPVVVNFVEKYHPKLIRNLAPFVPPMIAMAKIVRMKYGQNIKVIYIGPDIASKDVALKFNSDGKVDVVLTFPELRKLFSELKIDENLVDFSEFDDPIGYKGSLYPIINGFIQAADIDENLLTSNVISVEGKKEMFESINEFESNVKVIHRNLHVTYGNSLSGPGITSRGNKLFKEHLVTTYANKRLSNFFRAEWYDNLLKYQSLDYSREFQPDDQRLDEPEPEKIEEALKVLGGRVDRHTDCGQCGYTTCRDFAVDMAKGIVIPEMCSTFAIRNSKYYTQTLMELNEKLATTRQALHETEEKVLSEHDTALQASELTDAILEKLRAGIVFVDYKMKIVKANNTFCTILGEEAEEINEVIPGLIGADLNKFFADDICNLFSYVIENSESIDGRDVRHENILLNLSIFPIRENHIAGGIVRDMRAPEVQKAEVTRRVSEVIDKNLEMVQKIGFLLGEGASDIEKMLNSVIKIYDNDSKK
ncbi:MAG: 4Fe-4S dicluster domain-containing protein [Bacteroidales bacterium]|nr:4Fe-4S dicluster domain-containing protein [Bacteroidales bacterium]MBN2819018.1 4Fe-4S dicluster domain-containing protein [Bacteroidales bacterium]